MATHEYKQTVSEDRTPDGDVITGFLIAGCNVCTVGNRWRLFEKVGRGVLLALNG